MNNYSNITEEEKQKLLESINRQIEETRKAYEESIDEDMIGNPSLASKLQSLTTEKMHLSKVTPISSSNKDNEEMIPIDNLLDSYNSINQEDNIEELDESIDEPEQIEMLDDTIELNIETETEIEKLERLKKEIKQLQKQYYDSLDENLNGNKELETKIHDKRRELQSILNNQVSNVQPILKEDNSIETQINEAEKNNNEELNNIRVIFNGEKGIWEIHFWMNNEEKIELFSLDKEAIFKDKDIELDKDIITKYGLKVSSEIDYNLYLIFDEFDKKYDTSLKDDYINNKLSASIIYDFRKMYKASRELLNHSQKKALRKIAKEQEEFKNANVIKFNTKKAATLLVGASLAAGVVGVAVSNTNTNINNEPKVTTEKNIDATKEQDISQTTEKITEPVVTTEVTNNESNKENTEEIVKDDDAEVLSENNNEFIGPEQYGANILRVHDKMNLSDVTLRYTSQGANPYVNVDTLNCAYYKVSLIAILKDGRVYKAFEVNDEITNSNLLEIEERYQKQLGGDIKMQVNFNGYDKDDNMIYKNIGWTAVSEVKVKNEEKEEEEGKNKAK